MTGTERSSVLGGRREERTRSECVVVERSMPVRQPPRMTDHRESNDVWMVPEGHKRVVVVVLLFTTEPFCCFLIPCSLMFRLSAIVR